MNDPQATDVEEDQSEEVADDVDELDDEELSEQDEIDLKRLDNALATLDDESLRSGLSGITEKQRQDLAVELSLPRATMHLGTALTQAAEAAGDGDVAIGGGADVIRQALAAGKVDELVISTAPVILGAGKRLFDGFEGDMNLEVSKVYSSPYATHVRYTVAK